jgi:hypothetical protein
MRLEITIEAQKPYTVEVKEQAFTIGRSDKNIIRIQTDSISRTHLNMRIDQGKIYVTDLGSANGTYIDGEKLTPNQEVLWQTFFSLHLSDHVSIALAEEEVTRPEMVRSSTLNSIPQKDKKTEDTNQISVTQKKPLSSRNSKKQPETKKFPLSLFLTLIVLAGGIYFQIQMNKKEDGVNVATQEAQAKALQQKLESKKQLQKMTPILNQTKCQSDLEKELCLTLKVKNENGEGVLLKDKNLYILYNFKDRIKNVELDPSFSFANDPERQLYLMTFMLFRPDLRNIVISNGIESLMVIDINSSPLQILKTVSISSQDLGKLTMIDVETIFSNLLQKQDQKLFKSLVLGVIKEVDAN